MCDVGSNEANLKPALVLQVKVLGGAISQALRAVTALQQMMAPQSERCRHLTASQITLRREHLRVTTCAASCVNVIDAMQCNQCQTHHVCGIVCDTAWVCVNVIARVGQ
uniref:Uncharacterized protein n=1 Tax=Eutreptiella gymnastica TaxID=73025 RepID=A0A7S1ICI3_9EUGL|mmetsp:Transcript_147303/g.257377  ORF Transcript_147303/g.257377 Transcript_147303/m.257377 type:complete len:109 (+) Transcript_147303:554-880(+)